MRDAVRRLFSVRPQQRIVRVRVPSIIAGRRGLPVLLSAFAVVAAASTAGTTTVSDQVAAPAGTTVFPPVAPPTYSYPGAPAGTTALPPGVKPGGTGLNSGKSGVAVSADLAANGIPSRAAQAYKHAAVAADCGVPWTLVAAIGRVESNHGQFAGATLLADGRSNPPIIGIPLDGRPGVAEIKDTDHGKWDRDTTWDRAVGPMQFIPSSWATFGLDGNGDGTADPFNIDDAALSAAKYLCRAGGGDLSSVASQRNAVYSYNRSTTYVETVMALSTVYAGGTPIDGSPAPNGTPGPLPPIAVPTLPQASVGQPPAAPATTPPNTTPPPATTPPPGGPRPTPSTQPTGPTDPGPTTKPGTPGPTTQPGTPAPTTPPGTTTPPAPSGSPSPSPSPTCTPAPSGSPTPSPASSGTNTPNGTASAAATPASSASADPAATGTPTPTPTLPPCPS